MIICSYEAQDNIKLEQNLNEEMKQKKKKLQTLVFFVLYFMSLNVRNPFYLFFFIFYFFFFIHYICGSDTVVLKLIFVYCNLGTLYKKENFKMEIY
ncbi:hypothetical protein C0J52_20253 [Blattella germanica]|nr:hypothetical protein C0J52_20253 [Blattella germanica]